MKTLFQFRVKTMAAFVAVTVAFGASAPTAVRTLAAETSDWPQYRGPNRDNIAVNSPKLLDTWPKEGPPLAWKSDLIPGFYQGGCSGPVLADGKVYVYSTWKHPVGGGDLYKFITPDVLATWGWMPDVPADLAKKIEDARTQKGRPNCQGWPWWEIKEPKEKAKQLENFLAKKPELDKYIKDFLATLKPEEAKQYGDFIKRRLCITNWVGGGVIWEELEKLSKLQGVGFASFREVQLKLRQVAPNLGDGIEHHFYYQNWMFHAWEHCFTRTDTLVCLDAQTGKTLWKKEFPLDGEALSNLKAPTYADVLGVCATPVVWNAKCYFPGIAGLYCVSAKDGAPIWQVKRDAEQASPLVADGVIYLCGSAYNAETGQLLWKTPLWRPSGGWASQRYWSPTYVVVGGPSLPGGSAVASKTYVFSIADDNSICCLDLNTGKDIWTLKGQLLREVQVSGGVIIAQGKMYKMTTAGIQPIKTLVDFPGMGFDFNWVIYQDHLYQTIGKAEGGTRDAKAYGLCCLDLKSGDVKWGRPMEEEPTCFSDVGFCPSILADGKILATFGGFRYMWKNDEVAMYRATPEKYTLLGTFKPDVVPWAPMAVVGGKLFLRTEFGISCYDLTQYGPYIDKTIVTKDKVTFALKQTGGGLLAKAPSSPGGSAGASATNGVMITDAKGVATPARATVVGDTIVVDVKDVPAPFRISCGVTNSLAGKNGKPVSAFEWNEARALKFRTCFDNTIVLTSDILLAQNGTWNAAATYVVTGATVTNAVVDFWDGKTVTLTTDKVWKNGDVIALTYPEFPVDQGESRRETLKFTARDRSAARFVKIDETTSGNWKGVYGAEGAVIAWDATATSTCAVVTITGSTPPGMDHPDDWHASLNVWPLPASDVRALQKWGEAKDRIAARWVVANAGALLQIEIDFTDGREHQVALYCLDVKEQFVDVGRVMTVDVWDPLRNVVLVDKQTVKEFTNGRYLVMNLKGRVKLRIRSAENRWLNAVASGIFFDPPAQTGK